MDNELVDDFESFQNAVDTMVSFRVIVMLTTEGNGIIDVTSSPIPADVFESVRDRVEAFLNEGGTYSVWNQHNITLTLCPRERVVDIKFAFSFNRPDIK